jgi:hypothetical protein
LWPFFHVIAHNAEKCSTLLPTTPIIFRVVGHGAENFSNFNSCMVFRIVSHNADYFSTLWTTPRKKNYLRCSLYCRKMVGVVGNNAKNGRIRIAPQIRKQMLQIGFNQGPRLMFFMKKS